MYFFTVFVPLILFGAVVVCAVMCFFFPTIYVKDEDPGITMYSTYAGSVTADPDVYVPSEPVREGAIYTWAKQFHTRILVRSTPIGHTLAPVMKEVHDRQRSAVGLAATEGHTAKGLEPFIKDAEAGQPKAMIPMPDMARLTEEERVAKMEEIAVDMARKQQELVVALSVAQEKQDTLRSELQQLKAKKQDEVIAVGGALSKPKGPAPPPKDAKAGLQQFVDSWLGDGALIDAKLQQTPTPEDEDDVETGKKKKKQRQKSKVQAVVAISGPKEAEGGAAATNPMEEEKLSADAPAKEKPDGEKTKKRKSKKDTPDTAPSKQPEGGGEKKRKSKKG